MTFNETWKYTLEQKWKKNNQITNRWQAKDSELLDIHSLIVISWLDFVHVVCVFLLLTIISVEPRKYFQYVCSSQQWFWIVGAHFISSSTKNYHLNYVQVRGCEQGSISDFASIFFVKRTTNVKWKLPFLFH